MKLVLKTCLALCIWSTASMAQDTAQQALDKAVLEEIHVDLRALKQRLLDAVNKKDEGALLADLAPNVWFTAMNNETFNKTDGAKAYYAKMLGGESRIVKDLVLTAEPDDLAILYNNNTTAVSTGTSNASFKLATGQEFDVPLRWSAALVKESGKWQLANVHFSANMFDNAILTAAKNLAWWIGGAIAIAGLVIGWFFGRRSTRA
jgi:hypothetical protein